MTPDNSDGVFLKQRVLSATESGIHYKSRRTSGVWKPTQTKHQAYFISYSCMHSDHNHIGRVWSWPKLMALTMITYYRYRILQQTHWCYKTNFFLTTQTNTYSITNTNIDLSQQTRQWRWQHYNYIKLR